MIKSKLILCLFFLYSLSADAQITFQKCYGGSGGLSVQQTRDTGYIVSGLGQYLVTIQEDVFLIKTDKNGDTLWTRSYGGPDCGQCWAYGESVQQTSDGGYVIAGRRGNAIDSTPLTLLRTDANGILLWNKTYGGFADNRAYSVQQTTDGGFIIGGYTSSFGGFDAYMIKTDSLGNVMWERSIGEAADDYGRSIRQTSDGGYVILGSTNGYSNVSLDIYLIKMDANGNLLWSQIYGGPGLDYGYSVKQTADGGFIIAGSADSLAQDGTRDVYLIKTDGNGNLTWSKTFGAGWVDEGFSVDQTSDGGYVVAGLTEESPGIGFYDFYLLKTDANGNLVWSRTFGGTQYDYAFEVQQTFDGGYIVSGWTSSLGTGGVYLIKTDSLGHSGCNEATPPTVSGTPATQVRIPATIVLNVSGNVGSPPLMTGTGQAITTVCFTNSIQELYPGSDYKIYPNPFDQSATLEFENPRNEKHMLTIFDSRGRIVRTLTDITTNKIEIERKNLASGLYFFQLSSDRKLIAAGKFAVE